MRDIFLSFLVSVIVCSLLVPLARAIHHRLRSNSIGPPSLGGVVFLLATFLPPLAYFASTWGGDETLRLRAACLLGGCIVLCIVGALNDRQPLRGRWMLLGQFLAIAVVLLSDLTISEFRLFRWEFDLGNFGKLASAVVLLISVNAFRCLEDMDDLIACLGVIIMTAMSILAWMRGQPAGAALAAAAAGSLVGLLRHCIPPATIRLGSSGSMLMGLVIGTLAIAAAVKGATAVALAAPAALLTIPFFELAIGVVLRRRRSRPLYCKDHEHLHHCLRRRGLGQKKIVVFIGMIGLVTVAGALIGEWLRNEMYALLGALSAIAVLIAARLFGRPALSLFGQHMRSTVCKLLENSVNSARQIDATRPADWDRFWMESVRLCSESSGVKEVRLTVNGPDAFGLAWHAPGRFPVDDRLWHAQFPLSVDGRLEVTGIQNGNPVENRLTDLAQIIQKLEIQHLPQSTPSGPDVVQITRVHDTALNFEVNISRLKVCHLGKYYPPAPGGIETHVQTLARAQAKLGVDVRVLCANHADPSGRDVTGRRFTRTRTIVENDGPVRIKRFGRLASLAKLDLCPRLALELRHLLDDPPHIVHLHAPNPTMLLAVAWFCPALPLIVTHHSDIVKQRFLHYPFSVFERVVYGRAQRILTDSPPYAAGSQTLQGFMRRVIDLPLGLDLAPFADPSIAALEYADKLRSRQHGPLWLSVGRLTYYKGFEVALEALKHVPGNLLIIGTGLLESKLKNLASELGVADRVIWHGHATPDELVGSYLAATALWFPSNARSEGFGLVQVEAMAAGCPVINTAIPHSGVSWVAQDGETALTVPINDPVALAQAAKRLLNDSGLREQLVCEGRRRAMAEFDHMAMARRSLEIYRKVLEYSVKMIPETWTTESSEVLKSLV